MSMTGTRRAVCEDQLFHFGGKPADAVAAGEVVETVLVLLFGDSEGNHDVFLGSSAECGPTTEELNKEVVLTRASKTFREFVCHCCPNFADTVSINASCD